MMVADWEEVLEDMLTEIQGAKLSPIQSAYADVVRAIIEYERFLDEGGLEAEALHAIHGYRDTLGRSADCIAGELSAFE